MQILLVAATTFEIESLLDKLLLIGQQNEKLSHYKFNDADIDVLVTGIGMLQTAYFLGRQLSARQYDLAINAGIAGTFIKSFPLGTVVNVVEDCVPDLGAEDGENFLSVFELGLADPNAHPYTRGKLMNDSFHSVKHGINEIISKLPKVNAITSNTVRGNVESIARIRKLTEADIESMEGAAFFFSCLSAHVPCLQIRSISNLVEERDKSHWKIDLALKNLNKMLWNIITSHVQEG